MAAPRLIDTTTDFVGHPDLVAERLERFVTVLGPERVIVSTDRGSGSFTGHGAVGPEIAGPNSRRSPKVPDGKVRLRW